MKRLKRIVEKKRHFLLSSVNKIIENKLFKPISITIIAIFILFRIYLFLDYYFDGNIIKEGNFFTASDTKPIRISLTGSAIDFEFEDDQIIDHKVESGDTLLKILADIGVEEQDVFSILSALKKVKPSQTLNIGSEISVTFRVKDNKDDPTNSQKTIVVSNVSIPVAVDENISISRKSDGSFDAKEVKIKLIKYNSRYSGIIKNGLFVDGVDSGISPNTMMNMINLYGYDVDFQRDIHSGDKFEMLVESFYDESGKKVRDGNVLFSSLSLQNRKIDIYMHKINDRVEYFDAKGNSVKKSLLRTPINGARVSSGFGMRRHPILGYSKMHKGMDFAASTGTPILAAGNGTIVYMAVKGGYGNYVQIKHNNDYSTAYGHASRFNKKFRAGSKVKQGDVVAYVGSTGRSTGPHLHFELLYKGSQVNPAKVKATSGMKLTGKELARFEASKNEIDKYLKNTPNQLKR